MRSLRETTLQHGTRVNYIAPWYFVCPCANHPRNSFVDFFYRYIKTEILSDAVAKRITSKGAVFAEITDASDAAIKVAVDSRIHGKFSTSAICKSELG